LVPTDALCIMAQSGVKSAQEVAEQYEEGDFVEVDRKMNCGGSGKQRSKLEQHENKHKDPEGDTRRIVENIMHGEEKRREETRKKSEKDEEKPQPKEIGKK